MKRMPAAKTPLGDYQPYLSIVGATMFGIGIFALIPKSNAGKWQEVQEPENTWAEKRPVGSSSIYVNEER